MDSRHLFVKVLAAAFGEENVEHNFTDYGRPASCKIKIGKDEIWINFTSKSNFESPENQEILCERFVSHVLENPYIKGLVDNVNTS
jgi:hypothetical protein